DRFITRPKRVAEDVFVKLGKFHFLTDYFLVVEFEADPRVPLILGRSFLRTGRALIDVYGEEITLRINDEAVTFYLNKTIRYSSTYDDMSVNRIDIIDVAREEYAQEMLGFSNNFSGGNPTSTSEPIISDSSPSLTPFEGSDFILKEIEAYLKDETISPKIDHADCDPEGDICLIEKLLNNDPFQVPSMDLKQGEIVNAKSSIEEPPKLELKDLPYHLEYAYLEDCIDAFETLKKKLTEAPILVVLDWNLPFELMCDASDFAIGAVLGQQKEMLAVVYAFEKFRSYLVLSKSIVYTDHSALKYLLCKQDAKPRLLRWVLLLHEFDIIIRDKKRTKNLVADHLSRLENPYKDVFENKDINEKFPLETLGKISSASTSWTHLCNDKFAKVMSKYGVTHRLATAYHPQTSGQVEVSNCSLKRILERTVRENHASWSEKLEDALWGFRSAYKTPIGCTPYKLVYGKSCHLPIELEHKAYWALKHANFDLKTTDKTKKFHDSTIKNRIFNVGDQVLLFNSRLKIFSGKLKTRWSGPFTITKFFPYGTVELSQPGGSNFKVNGHRVKHYYGGDVPQLVVPNLQTISMDK
nr:reverse transcriptase domain-containing protein [Tanacetum cinerariifolium]